MILKGLVTSVLNPPSGRCPCSWPVRLAMSFVEKPLGSAHGDPGQWRAQKTSNVLHDVSPLSRWCGSWCQAHALCIGWLSGSNTRFRGSPGIGNRPAQVIHGFRRGGFASESSPKKPRSVAGVRCANHFATLTQMTCKCVVHRKKRVVGLSARRESPDSQRWAL